MHLYSPLIPTVCISKRHLQHVQYEGIEFCFGYGLIGHNLPSCPQDKPSTPLTEAFPSTDRLYDSSRGDSSDVVKGEALSISLINKSLLSNMETNLSYGECDIVPPQKNVP